MNTAFIIEKLKEQKLLDQTVQKYTLLINDKMDEQGALFFIPLGQNKEVKIVISAPHHQALMNSKENLTYQMLLNNKNIMVLK